MEPEKIRILLCCMGNICRSPTAEGVLRARARRAGLERRLHIDSAGTHEYHIGHPPDTRAQTAARARGYDLSSLRARRVVAEDFSRFDYILAMDRDNLRELARLAGKSFEGHLGLFLDFAPRLGLKEVPDPYYGGREGFEEVLDLVEAASDGLLEHLRQRLEKQ
jgi:protein-tyrosine phosphatase